MCLGISMSDTFGHTLRGRERERRAEEEEDWRRCRNRATDVTDFLGLAHGATF